MSRIVRTVVALAFVSALGSAAHAADDAPTVFAPGVISGPVHDSAPAFTHDGARVYFSRSTPAASTILVAPRHGDGWSTPEIAAFSGVWNDMEPALAPDDSFLVFVSNRPATPGGTPLDGHYGGKTLPGLGGNLWKVPRDGSGWGTPVHLPASINAGDSVFAPSVAADGSLYFMRPAASGKFQLFRAQFAHGDYAEPKALPFSDGSVSDVDPAVAPDESFLVFGSGRPPAQGMDLYVVRRGTDGAWGTPRHLGRRVNSAGSDAEPRLSPDLKTLYFSSERTLPVHFPRTLAKARADEARALAWDNGLYNIWQVALGPLLAEPAP